MCMCTASHVHVSIVLVSLELQFGSELQSELNLMLITCSNVYAGMYHVCTLGYTSYGHVVTELFVHVSSSSCHYCSCMN